LSDMPIIESYDDKTYVAFLDISGFEAMMERIDRAKMGLDKFNTALFEAGLNFQETNRTAGIIQINTLIFSDCAVIFSRNNSDYEDDKIIGLSSLLKYIRRANRILIDPMVKPVILTTCSIAYGDFKYDNNKIEYEGIDKRAFIGWPYVRAYQDNSIFKPKIDVGECRIRKENLELPHNYKNRDEIFNYLKSTDSHYYFYWMVNSIEDIDIFIKEYKYDYYEQKKRLLQKYTNLERSELMHFRRARIHI